MKSINCRWTIIWDVFFQSGRCWFHRSPDHPIILGWGMVGSSCTWNARYASHAKCFTNESLGWKYASFQDYQESSKAGWSTPIFSCSSTWFDDFWGVVPWEIWSPAAAFSNCFFPIKNDETWPFQRISQQKTPETVFFLNEYRNKMAEKIKWSRFNTFNEAGRLPSHLGVSFSLKNILIPIDFTSDACKSLATEFVKPFRRNKNHTTNMYIYTSTCHDSYYCKLVF